MSEKEMKKLDEKGEEKISGGLKMSKDELKKVLSKIKTDANPILAYGGPSFFPKFIPGLKKKKAEEEKNKKKPEEALTASQPQAEEEKK